MVVDRLQYANMEGELLQYLHTASLEVGTAWKASHYTEGDALTSCNELIHPYVISYCTFETLLSTLFLSSVSCLVCTLCRIFTEVPVPVVSVAPMPMS